MANGKRVTITSIAQNLELSVATVSYVMNGKVEQNGIPEKTAERVRNEAKRLGYVPNDLARSLRRQKTGSIGILLSDLQQGWAERLIKGVLSVLDQKEYVPYMTIHFWDPAREIRELEFMVKRRMEAIITVPMIENADFYNAINRQGIPVVFIQDELVQCPDVSFCMWDAREAAKAGVRHLLATGRKKIGFVGVQHFTPWLEMRLEGYKEALRQAGAEMNSNWICLDKREAIALGSEVESHFGESLEKMLKNTPKDDLPDAFLTMNDAVAMTALHVIKDRLGYTVPGDFAVVGMGDLAFAPLVELTTAREPVEEVGRQAARTALRLIDSETSGQMRTLVTNEDIIIRRSSGPLVVA